LRKVNVVVNAVNASRDFQVIFIILYTAYFCNILESIEKLSDSLYYKMLQEF